MRTAAKTMTLLLLISTVSLLEGCTLVYYPFFRNFSDLPVELNFKLSSYSERKMVLFKQSILDIGTKTYKELSDSLPIERHDDERVSIIIPPKSTVLLPRGHYYTDTLLVRQNERLDSIFFQDLKQTEKSFQVKRSSFPIRYIFFYDYR